MNADDLDIFIEKSNLIKLNLDKFNSDNDDINKIKIFVNSYIPDSYPSDETSLKYELIVNGISHKVTPINNYSNGTKMVSHAISQYGNSSVKFIDESIKTLQLKITIKASSGAITPFVGNVKVCIG